MLNQQLTCTVCCRSKTYNMAKDPYLISPNTQPAFSVTNTMLLSGPPTTCTAPLLMMYISFPMSPCPADRGAQQSEQIEVNGRTANNGHQRPVLHRLLCIATLLHKSLSLLGQDYGDYDYEDNLQKLKAKLFRRDIIPQSILKYNCQRKEYIL